MGAELEILDPRQQQARLGGDGAAGLHQEFQTTPLEPRGDCGNVLRRRRRRLVAIAHTQTTTHIEMGDGNTVFRQLVDERQSAIQGIDEWRQGRELRSDMEVDALDGDAAEVRRTGKQRGRIVDGNAKLVFLQTSGDIGMGIGIDIGIHAHGDWRDRTEAGRHSIEPLQLSLGFDVETIDSGLQSAAHLRLTFADTGEHHLRGIPAGGQYALQLARRDDVEAGAETREDIQHAEVGVGLDRIADAVIDSRQGIVESPPVGLQSRPRVDVAGRAVALGDDIQGHLLSRQLVVLVVKEFHGLTR